MTISLPGPRTEVPCLQDLEGWGLSRAALHCPPHLTPTPSGSFLKPQVEGPMGGKEPSVLPMATTSPEPHLTSLTSGENVFSAGPPMKGTGLLTEPDPNRLTALADLQQQPGTH